MFSAFGVFGASLSLDLRLLVTFPDQQKPEEGKCIY